MAQQAFSCVYSIKIGYLIVIQSSGSRRLMAKSTRISVDVAWKSQGPKNDQCFSSSSRHMLFSLHNISNADYTIPLQRIHDIRFSGSRDVA